MLNILASGTLVSDPKSRTTAAGKAYATASMRCPAEDSDAVLVSIIAFNADAVAALLALSKGDSVSIAGRGKLTEWEKDGEQKHGLSVVADRVMSAYQAGRVRKAARELRAPKTIGRLWNGSKNEAPSNGTVPPRPFSTAPSGCLYRL